MNNHDENQALTESDPLLTAYVLGELEGAELARVEAALARDPALRVSVERIRVTCGAIGAALAGEGGGNVPADEETARGAGGRDRPAAGQVKGARETRPVRRRRQGELLRYPGLYFVVGGLSAACFALVATLTRPVEETSAGGLGVAGSIPTPGTLTGRGSGFSAVMAGKESQRRLRVVEESTPGEPVEQIPVGGGDFPVVAEVAVREPLVPSIPVERGVARVDVGVESRVDMRQESHAEPVPASREGAESSVVPLVEAPMSPRLQFAGFGAGTSLRPFEGASSSAPDRDFVPTRARPVSELGVQTETASLEQVRRALLAGRRPERALVHVEQLLNTFPFTRVEPSAPEAMRGGSRESLVATRIEYAPAPWEPRHLLVRISVQASPQPETARAPERIVVLVDEALAAGERRVLSEALRGVSARLHAGDRLSLGRLGSGEASLACSVEVRTGRAEFASALGLLFGEEGSAGAALSLPDILRPGEATPASIAGASGAAASVAVSPELLREAGRATRLIVCSAGEPRLPGSLLSAGSAPVSLLTLGAAGARGPSAATLQALAARGTGLRSDRADTVARARELLLEQAGGPVPVLARGVLLSTEFNPALVASHRVLGYEGGEGAFAAATPSDLPPGQSFTALYELIPTPEGGATAEALARGRRGGDAEDTPAPGVLFKVRLGYEDARRGVACSRTYKVLNGPSGWEGASDDFRFAAAVAAMGMILRDSPHRGVATLDMVARFSSGRDVSVSPADREDFARLLGAARRVY